MLRVTEIFSSIQGEGINMGRFATFVRLTGCPLRCAYCDTKYALTGGTEMSYEEVETRLYKLDPYPGMVVFTGGEPMLQSDALYELVEGSRTKFFDSPTELAIETSGAFPLDAFVVEWIDYMTISPKLKTACEDGYSIPILREWIKFGRGVEFKFVVTCAEDLVEIYRIMVHVDWDAPVTLQPDGRKEPYDLALRELYGWVKVWPYRRKVRILPQLHRIMWERDARGV